MDFAAVEGFNWGRDLSKNSTAWPWQQWRLRSPSLFRLTPLAAVEPPY